MIALERPTGRAVRAFAEGVEGWRGDPADATSRLDIEELIAVGNKAYEAVVDLDGRWHESLAEGIRPHDGRMLEAIEGLYLAWADPAGRLAAIARAAPGLGREVRGLDALLANLDVAAAVVDEDACVMSDELTSLRDGAVAEHREGRTIDLADGPGRSP